MNEITERLNKLMLGVEPESFQEKLFVKGYKDALNGKTLIKSFVEIGDMDDLETIELYHFLIGYSVGNASIAMLLDPETEGVSDV
jgi:hypothetical protein